MGSKRKIQAPKERDYGREMRQALEAQAGIKGTVMGLERQWAPQMQSLQRDLFSSQIQNLGSLVTQARPIAERITDENMSFMKSRLPGITQTAINSYESGMGRSAGLLSLAEQQAYEGLRLGRSLSPEEEAMAEQASRSAMAARGITGGNQAIMSEVLQNYNLSTNREDRRRNYASDVYGIRQGTLNNALSTYGQTMLNNLIANSPSGMITAAGGMMQQPTGGNFSPESQMLSNIIGANQGNKMQVDMFNTSQRSNVAQNVMGVGGAVIGGMYGGPQGAAVGYQAGSGVGSMFG